MSEKTAMTTNTTVGPKCAECGDGHLVRFLRDEELDYDLGDETIKVLVKEVPVERCDHCGAVASGYPAAMARHEAVRRAELKSKSEKVHNSHQQISPLAVSPRPVPGCDAPDAAANNTKR